MRILKRLLMGLVINLVLLVVYIVYKIVMPGWTPPIVGPHSIEKLEKAKLGGVYRSTY